MPSPHETSGWLPTFLCKPKLETDSGLNDFAPAEAAAGHPAEARRQFKSLPPEEYPTLIELADELTEDHPDALFKFGLETWLRGLEKFARRGAHESGPAIWKALK